MEFEQPSGVESVPHPPGATGDEAPPNPPDKSPVDSPKPLRIRAHSRADSAGESGSTPTKRSGSSTNVTFFKTLGSFSNKNRITAKKNSTFAGGNRLTRKDSGGNVNARRSVSFDRSTFSKQASEPAGGRLLVGKGLKRAKEIVVAIDELNEESHKVNDEVLQNISIVNPEKQLEVLAEVEGPEEDDNVCICIGHHKEKGTGIRRSSEVFIGGDGFFPLSQIKMPRPVYFTMNYDDFEDVKHLTDGSNSVIYKAKSGKMVSYHHAGSRLPSRIVLKVLSEQVKDPRRAKREFDFERDILAALSHSNIVNIYGSGFYQSRPFLVMERLDGGSLQYLLAEADECQCRIPLRKALQITRDLANAIQYLHHDFHPDAVLIHRDLKPDNICFTSEGVVKLMDFGISTCMRRSVLKKKPYEMSGMTGSLRYMAPEVAKRLPYTEKVDIYSFGIVIWQVLTAITPFDRFNRETFLETVVMGGQRPDIEELDDAILQGSNEFLTELCDDLKGIIASCWDEDYQQRPEMKDLTEKFTKMYSDYARGAGSVQSCCTVM